MSLPLQAVLNTLITSLPYRILSYYPFWRHHLRLPKWLVALFIGSSELAFLTAAFFCVRQGRNLRVVEAFLSVVCFCIYLFCIRVKVSKLVFFYLFVFDYIMIIRGLGVFLTVHLMPEGAHIFYSWENSVAQLLLFFLALPLILMFLRRTVERIFRTDAPILWRTIWMPPALMTLVMQIYTGSLNPAVVEQWVFLFTRICLLISMFVVYYVLLRSLDVIRAQAALEERAVQAEKIAALQRTQYSMLQKRIEDTRRARHDLRQHLNMIQAYLDSGDRQALSEYLVAYRKRLPEDTTQVYCKNYAVDVVVRYYAQQAQQSGIPFEMRIELPQQLAVEEPDLCVLLGNLLENALDACRAQKRGERFIRVCARIMGGEAVSLTVDNSSDAAPVVSDGRFQSSKHEGSGMGTASVEQIAKQYNGIAKFDYKEHVFYSSVLLNP